MAGISTSTGIGRHFDFSLASNRFALIGSIVSFAVFAVLSFVRDDLSIFGAVFASVAVFLGWAVGRELDPDYPGLAGWSMALAFLFALFNTPAALATGVCLLAIRFVAGTIGASVQPLDLPAVGIVGFVSAASPSLWMAGMATGLWLWFAPEVGRLRMWGVGLFGAGVVGGLGYAAWAVSYGDGFDVEITATAYVLAAAAGLAMILSARPFGIESPTDVGEGVIDAARIRLARLTAGAICMWAAVMGGVDGFWAVGPVFAALAMAAVYRVFVRPAQPAQP